MSSCLASCRPADLFQALRSSVTIFLAPGKHREDSEQKCYRGDHYETGTAGVARALERSSSDALSLGCNTSEMVLFLDDSHCACHERLRILREPTLSSANVCARVDAGILPAMIPVGRRRRLVHIWDGLKVPRNTRLPLARSSLWGIKPLG